MLERNAKFSGYLNNKLLFIKLLGYLNTKLFFIKFSGYLNTKFFCITDRCEDTLTKSMCRRLKRQCKVPLFIERMKEYCYDSCGYCSELKIYVYIGSGVSTGGGGQGAMDPCLAPSYCKVSIKNSMFCSKTVQLFFEFVSVALFILLNAIFIAFI